MLATGHRRKKRPRAVDPYLGFYPESELDPTSDEPAAKRRRFEDTSIASDTSATHTELRARHSETSAILRAFTSPDPEEDPQPSRYAASARSRRCVDSQECASNAEEQDAYWDEPPSTHAQTAIAQNKGKAKANRKPVKKLGTASGARPDFMHRLINKALTTGVKLDDDLERINRTTVPQLKMTDKPLSRSVRRAGATQRPRTQSRMVEHSFNQDKVEARKKKSGSRRVAMSMLRQPVVPRVFAPIVKQNVKRPRKMGLATKSRATKRTTAATAEHTSGVASFKPLKMTDTKTFDAALALRMPIRHKRGDFSQLQAPELPPLKLTTVQVLRRRRRNAAQNHAPAAEESVEQLIDDDWNVLNDDSAPFPMPVTPPPTLPAPDIDQINDELRFDSIFSSPTRRRIEPQLISPQLPRSASYAPPQNLLTGILDDYLRPSPSAHQTRLDTNDASVSLQQEPLHLFYRESNSPPLNPYDDGIIYVPETPPHSPRSSSSHCTTTSECNDMYTELLVPASSDFDVPASFVYNSRMERTGFALDADGVQVGTPLPDGFEVLVPNSNQLLAQDTPLRRKAAVSPPYALQITPSIRATNMPKFQQTGQMETISTTLLVHASPPRQPSSAFLQPRPRLTIGDLNKRYLENAAVNAPLVRAAQKQQQMLERRRRAS
ncbi:hypothetical protein BKA62DRAFT_698954 [Auriculariales sp. MPI-PUGE-AT-0066]|nr:hypothetical protein BKA62DRAFT_698954 [Auriculariales sp. MPI-PUGE-AT-0066]